MSQVTIRVDQLKTRLDKFLAENCHDFSRSQIQRDIEHNQVTVNGEIQNQPKFIVRKDDTVVYKIIPNLPPAPINLPIKTLHNDKELLILDKPAGLAVHPGAGFVGDSLAQALLYHFKDIRLVGEEGRNGIVHRLDKDTSGVMLVALTQKMYEFLKEAFLKHRVQKEYIALVAGKMEENHGIIEKVLGKSKRDFRKYTTDIADMLLQKPSKTEYWVLEHLQGSESPVSSAEKAKSRSKPRVDDYTLIKVKLHTGRTHQIRVHLASIKHPLIGDELYGKKKVLRANLSRQFLHSHHIKLQLPNGDWIEKTSKLPVDLRNFLEKLKSKTLNQL